MTGLSRNQKKTMDVVLGRVIKDGAQPGLILSGRHSVWKLLARRLDYPASSNQIRPPMLKRFPRVTAKV